MNQGPILTLDVGGGTQDLLLWEPGQPMENAVQMVLPAPTRVVARRLARLASQARPIFLTGGVMGGGAVTGALRSLLTRDIKVYATPQAALTFSDRLEVVEGWGVTLVESPPDEAVPLTLGDIDLEGLGRVFEVYEIPRPAHFAVAVQDHGFHPQGSNRRFRFQHWENFLSQSGRLADLAFRQPPPYFTRMQAVQETLPGALLMDTCAAGVRGALLDPRAREHQPAGLMALNLGNAHTFAALIQGERLWGIYEHHTGMLDRAKLFSQLGRFLAGELTNDEVFADGGHGCAYAPGYPAAGPFSFTVITGPQRRLAGGWPGVFAAPFGNMMLAGCFGLMAAFLEESKSSVAFGNLI